MILPFNPSERSIYLPVRLFGPRRQAVARMALDTGANRSAVSVSIAEFVGYDLALFEDDVTLITLGGTTAIRRFTAQRIEIQEQSRTDFPMLCVRMLDEVGIDGIIGLDFLRGRKLTLDFRPGLLTLD